jgi:predicted Zn-dependent peptidase
MGTQAYAADNPKRWALYLLNNILGGPGLNSRLNLSLRERNGLVYSVESSMVCYGNTGSWCTYFGCDPHDIKRCCRLVRRELNLLMEHPLSATQLRKAKQQLQGQLAIACDSREQFALDFAKTFLHQGKERDLNDIMRHIDRLTPEDLQEVACDIFAEDHITTLIYK